MPRKNNGQHAPYFTKEDLGHKSSDRIPRGQPAPPRSENHPKPEGNKPTGKDN